MSVRFGVAISKELAERLDEIAKRLNLPRSKVVEMAISAFIDYLSAMEDPNKSKLLIVVAKKEEVDKVVRVMKESGLQGCMGFGKNFAFMAIMVQGDVKEIMEKLKSIKGTLHPVVFP